MPNRLLREGICTSDLINALTEEEEVLFYRMLVVADDYGHLDGRLSILKALCFPLRESATTKAIEAWLMGLIAKSMVRRYEVDGKPYLAILKWEARVRTHPKYPLPDDDGARWVDDEATAGCEHLSADCGQPSAIGGLGKGKGKGKGATSRTSRELRPLPDDWVPSEATVSRLSREFGLRVPEDVDRYVAAFRDACKARAYVYQNFDSAFSNCVRQDWPKYRNGTKATRDPFAGAK